MDKRPSQKSKRSGWYTTERQGSITDKQDDYSDTGVPRKEMLSLAVAANTTMLHLLLGIDPSSLGCAPFTPIFTDAKSLPAAEIGLAAETGAVAHCLPSVSASIGGDIVASMHVAGLWHAPGTVLFIDIRYHRGDGPGPCGDLCACTCAGAIEDVCLTDQQSTSLQLIIESIQASLRHIFLKQALPKPAKVREIVPKRN